MIVPEEKMVKNVDVIESKMISNSKVIVIAEHVTTILAK